MSPFVTAGYDAALSGGLGNAIAFVSLHNGDPSTTGANEIAGGGYARQAVAWNAAASGQRTNSGALSWSVAATTTIYHVGFFSALTGGTFYGYAPLGNGSPQVATAAAIGDVFTSYAHGYTDAQQVIVFDIQAAGFPGGLTEGTVYYVNQQTVDTFLLTTDQPLTATVDITTTGECGVQLVVPETFASAGTLTVAIGTLSLDARFG